MQREEDGTTMKVVSTFTEELPVELSERELLEAGQALAKLEADREAHAVHAAHVRGELKKREEALEEQIQKVSKAIRDRTELREVKCQGWADYIRNVFEQVRCDTGQVVPGTVRPLSPEERQGELLNLGESGYRPKKKRGNDVDTRSRAAGSDDAA